VLVVDGEAHLVRSRDEPEDLLRPQHLYSVTPDSTHHRSEPA
jgi:diaminopimelate decarboxylase